MRDTMIQYQNVFDAFMRCDTDKLAEEFAALYDESKKDAEKRLEAVQKMIHASYERMKNTTLASNEDESMVVVCKSFDDAGDDDLVSRCGVNTKTFDPSMTVAALECAALQRCSFLLST